MGNIIKYIKLDDYTVVILNGKKVGTINTVVGGYQYFPCKSKIGGRIFSTISEVKLSLNF